MPSERTWTRIYLDRMKLSSLSNYLSDKKRGELGVKGCLKGPDSAKFDLERVFARLPTNQLISDTGIDEIVDKFLLSGKSESVERVVNRLVKDQDSGSSKNSSPKGELLLLEANSPVEEGLRIHRPSGTSLPSSRRGLVLGI